MPNKVSSLVTNSFWLTSKYIPIIPSPTPIKDFGFIFLLSINRINNNTNNGCVDANKAPNPLSIYFKAQTKTPLP